MVFVQPAWLAHQTDGRREMLFLTYHGLPLFSLFLLFYGLACVFGMQIPFVRRMLLVVAACTVVNIFVLGPHLANPTPTTGWAQLDFARWCIGIVSFSAMLRTLRFLRGLPLRAQTQIETA
jgi:hypothetical protein